MDVIKEARNLGKAIQSDPRFLRYAKALPFGNDDKHASCRTREVILIL